MLAFNNGLMKNGIVLTIKINSDKSHQITFNFCRNPLNTCPKASFNNTPIVLVGPILYQEYPYLPTKNLSSQNYP